MAHKFSKKESLFEISFIPFLIGELEATNKEEMAFYMVLSKSLEEAIHLRHKKFISKNELRIWHKNYQKAKGLGFNETKKAVELVNKLGIKTDLSKAEDLSRRLIEELRLEAELFAPKPQSKPSSTASRKHLTRLVLWNHDRLDVFVRAYADRLAKKGIHLGILENVIEQLNKDEIDEKEFDDWVSLWKSAKSEEGGGDPAEIHKSLGLEGLKRSKQELELQIIAELANTIKFFRKSYKTQTKSA